MWCLRARGASHNDRLSTQHIIYQSVRYEQIVNYQANEQTATLIVRRLSGVSAWNTCFNGIRVWCCYCTLHSAQCVWSSSNSIHNEPPMFESCSELMPNCKREHKSGMRKFFSSIFSLSLSSAKLRAHVDGTHKRIHHHYCYYFINILLHEACLFHSHMVSMLINWWASPKPLPWCLASTHIHTRTHISFFTNSLVTWRSSTANIYEDEFAM